MQLANCSTALIRRVHYTRSVLISLDLIVSKIFTEHFQYQSGDSPSCSSGSRVKIFDDTLVETQIKNSIAVLQPLIPLFLGMLAAEMLHWKNVFLSFHNGEVNKGMIVQLCGI